MRCYDISDLLLFSHYAITKITLYSVFIVIFFPHVCFLIQGEDLSLLLEILAHLDFFV